MKNIILLIISFSISNLCQAQNDSITAPKWSYEVMFAPNVSYRILTSSGGEEWHKEDRNNAEVARFGYSIKIGIIRTLNDRWSIGSGLTYSRIGFKIKASPLTWETPNEGFPTELRSTSRYTYIGLPILAYYKLNEKSKWRPELIFGASINMFLNKNVISEVKVNDDWISYPNEGFIYNDYNFFAHIGIGGSYRLSKRWLFKTSLIFNQSFIPTNSMSKTKEYLNYLGLNIGVNYRFAKSINR